MEKSINDKTQNLVQKPSFDTQNQLAKYGEATQTYYSIGWDNYQSGRRYNK